MMIRFRLNRRRLGGVLLLLWAALCGGRAGAENVVVDHTNWDWYAGQGQTVTDAVAAQKVFFAHASVGSYIMQGFADLQAGDAAKYPLAQISVSGSPSGTVAAGMICEYGRGNPGWAAKVSGFESCLSAGWHAPQVGWVMNKFCYIDQTADWAAYRDSMAALELGHPDTRFIYWTMPLTVETDSDAVLRAQFNQALRAWIATQDHKVLFDIADIEAWSPGGTHNTFLYNGTSYEALDAAYSLDGGHPNPAGSQRLASGLYSVLGLAMVTPTTVPTSTPGGPAAPKVFPNPARGAVHFEVPAGNPGRVEILIFNFAGELVASLVAQAAGAAAAQVTWDAGRAAPGVYAAQIRAPGQPVRKVKFALTR